MELTLPVTAEQLESEARFPAVVHGHDADSLRDDGRDAGDGGDDGYPIHIYTAEFL